MLYCSKRLCSVLVSSSRRIHTSIFAAMPVKVGDKLPNSTLFEGTPNTKVDIGKLLEGKKAVIFGVPGAFTPGCSKTHLPGYIENIDAIKSKGVHEVICVSVNDPFVMGAWGEQHKAEGKVRMLADPAGNFTKAIDMEVDATGVLGNVRCKRFSMVVENGVVKDVNVEPDNFGLTCTLAPETMKKL